jgi:hypothetical protein
LKIDTTATVGVIEALKPDEIEQKMTSREHHHGASRARRAENQDSNQEEQRQCARRKSCQHQRRGGKRQSNLGKLTSTLVRNCRGRLFTSRARLHVVFVQDQDAVANMQDANAETQDASVKMHRLLRMPWHSGASGKMQDGNRGTQDGRDL